jgi:hypothetical protein
MSNGFVKVYGGRLLSSSLWSECWQARLVFLSMLAAADKDGCVDAMGTRALARVINLSIEDTEIGLAVLESADPDSRDKAHEGRRVIRTDGGWLVLNRVKYRDLRSERQKQDAARQARLRARHVGHSVTSRSVTHESRGVTIREKSRRRKLETQCVTNDSDQVSASLDGDSGASDDDETSAEYRELIEAYERGDVVDNGDCEAAAEETSRWNRLNSDDPRLVAAFDVAAGTRDPTVPPAPWHTRRKRST